MSDFKLKAGINKCTNSEYHGDKTWLSSSQLKLILKSRAKFHDEVILGNRISSTSTAFDEGSYVHSLILEPEMIKEEYAFFEGWRKQGKDWTAFKAEYGDSGRILLSKPQAKRCESYHNAFTKREEAVKLISNGKPEESICAEINGMKLKMRSDWINVEDGYIADVKTSAFPVDSESFKMTMDKYDYQLSGALYSMIAEEYYGKPFDFYYVAISKSDIVCEVFKTSDDTMTEGRHKVLKAIKTYKECIESGDWTDPRAFDAEETSNTDYEVLEV